MRKQGITGRTLNAKASLEDRIFVLDVHNHTSNRVTHLCDVQSITGVPQGLIVSPIGAWNVGTMDAQTVTKKYFDTPR